MRLRQILCEVRLSNTSVAKISWPEVIDEKIRNKLLRIIAKDKSITRPIPQSDELEVVNFREINRILAHLGDWAANSPDTFRNTIIGQSNSVTLSHINNLADQYFAQQVKKANQNDISGAIPVMKLSNGFKWMKLTTATALNREGKLMGHCVGSYAKQVENNVTQIYSLWDSSNQPHCTIEIKNEEIVEIKGKQNQPVVERYWPYVHQFVFNSKLGVNKDEMQNIGLIFANDEWMDFRYLPDNLYVDGSLRLRGTSITRLPRNLHVDGDLDLSETPITHLSDNLRVGGSLYLDESKIITLPDNLRVGGSLYLRDTKITALPDNLRVGRMLYLRNTKITTLPNNLLVGGGLYLRDTKITTLPDNLYVGGDLYLDDGQITSFPNNLKLGGKVITK